MRDFFLYSGFVFTVLVLFGLGEKLFLDGPSLTLVEIAEVSFFISIISLSVPSLVLWVIR